jgi:hypothetical protein
VTFLFLTCLKGRIFWRYKDLFYYTVEVVLTYLSISMTCGKRSTNHAAKLPPEKQKSSAVLKPVLVVEVVHNHTGLAMTDPDVILGDKTAIPVLHFTGGVRVSRDYSVRKRVSVPVCTVRY